MIDPLVSSFLVPFDVIVVWKHIALLHYDQMLWFHFELQITTGTFWLQNRSVC